MAKANKSPKQPKASSYSDDKGRVMSRDLKKVNPLVEQFEPTAAEPMRQHYKYAGGC